MKNFSLAILLILFFGNCKNAKSDLNGNEKISAEDFLKAFHKINLPVTIADTAIQNFNDSVEISKAVFAQFIPDSALQKFSDPPNDNYLIRPAGMIHQKQKDFLLATFAPDLSVKKKNKIIQLGVFVLDDKHKFLSSFFLLNNERKDKYSRSLTITEEPTFIIKKETLATDNTSLYSRNGFAYNASTNSFTEVLHDSNEDTAKRNEIINPIDTLASTNKFSGDYIKDEKNFISVRDGKNATTYSFFIHFEKSGGNCIGELKGMMSLTNEKNAVFTESGDPCVINFKFGNNSITIKEQNNCGNHRGITCPFDFTFNKKMPAKNKSK